MAATTDPTDTMATTARGLLMPSPLPTPTLLLTRLLTPGTTATATDPGDTTDPTDTATTTARGLLMPSPSPLPLPIPLPTLLPTPGMDTMDGADTVATTDLTGTTDTTARGLLMPRPPQILLLIPPLTRGMDTTDTVDGTDPTTAMDTTDTGHTGMATGDAKTLATKLNIVLSLPTNTTEDQFLQNISLILFFKYFVLFNRVPGFIFQLKNNKVVKN